MLNDFNDMLLLIVCFSALGCKLHKASESACLGQVRTEKVCMYVIILHVKTNYFENTYVQMIRKRSKSTLMELNV